MSFFCNFQSDRCPGQITGNPLNGLCEKVCIQVKKVFDACMQQQQLTGVVLNLTNFTPANPTYPLTFISARSTTARGTISNLLIDPIADKPNSARVRADVTIPVTVAYTDANGVEGVATSSFTVTKDVILCVPAVRDAVRSGSRGLHGLRGRDLYGRGTVYHQRLFHGDSENRHGSGASGSVLRLLRHSALPELLAGSLRGIFRAADLSAVVVRFSGDRIRGPFF